MRLGISIVLVVNDGYYMMNVSTCVILLSMH